MIDLVQTLVFGLATGGVIAVGAVGLSLSYGVTRFINFSYGELLTLGAYLAVFLATLGLPLVGAVPGAMLVTGILMVGLARLVFEPLMRRGPLPLLVTSVGLAFVLQNVVRMVAGSSAIRFPLPLVRPWTFGELFVPRVPVYVIAVALLAMLAVHLMLSRSDVGKRMRAVSDDPELARACGIRTRRVLDATWFASAAIAGLSGTLLGITQLALQPVMGWNFLLVVFAAVLLGGIGHAYGAMVGALIVGLGIEFGSTYLSADYGYAFAFVILVGVLLFRPSGLFGARS
jgi:branched-subunit amino acid ABC-type transport system permease component